MQKTQVQSQQSAEQIGPALLGQSPIQKSEKVDENKSSDQSERKELGVSAEQMDSAVLSNPIQKGEGKVQDNKRNERNEVQTRQESGQASEKKEQGEESRYNKKFQNLLFYRGQIKIPQYNQRISQILLWDDQKLEQEHAFIQWLFPTKQPSMFNYRSFPFTEEEISQFKLDQKALENYMKALHRIGKFFGFGVIQDSSKVIALQNLRQRFQECFIYNTHNRLRMSRILQSLYETGHKEIMRNLSQLLKTKFIQLNYWRAMQKTYQEFYQPQKVIKLSEKQHRQRRYF